MNTDIQKLAAGTTVYDKVQMIEDMTAAGESIHQKE